MSFDGVDAVDMKNIQRANMVNNSQSKTIKFIYTSAYENVHVFACLLIQQSAKLHVGRQSVTFMKQFEAVKYSKNILRETAQSKSFFNRCAYDGDEKEIDFVACCHYLRCTLRQCSLTKLC